MSALARLLALQPVLRSVATAAEAIALPPRVLLHAGPPLRDPRRPPQVLRSSAAQVCVHEGWSQDAARADALIDDGAVSFEPAQAHACVVPLASLVSAGTPLFVVDDGVGGDAMHAPLSVVGGIDLRMGTRDAGLGERLAERDRRDAPAWQSLLGTHGPLAVLPLACAGLAGGDDLHSRTTSATEALAEQLRECGSTRLAEAVAATPAYFLTLWMAACALILRAAEGGDRPTLVTRAGGNGERFAIGLANAASTWIAVDAMPPSGRITATANAAATVCGAIGDSAVIDILGLGALSMAGAPEVLKGFDGYLPAHHAALAGHLLAADHPVLGRRVALDAARVAATGEAPLVALGMLAADGRGGLLGRGLYKPPLSLFAAALA